MKLRLRARSIRLAGATILAAALAACGKGDADTADGSTLTSSAAEADTGSLTGGGISLPVVAEPVREGDLVLTVNTTGQVRSDAEAKLRSEVAGTVQTVYVRPGDSVTRGDSIISFDPRPFDLAVRMAEVELDGAVIRARDNYIPDSIITGKDPPAERIKFAELRNGVDASRVRLDQARLDRERAVIVAPFDGVIDRVSVAAGERVGAGADIATVVDLARLRIEASVLQHDMPLVKVGGAATVSGAAAPNGAAAGRIVAVLPLVDSTTRAGRVYVRLQGNGVLRPGMYVDLSLEASRLTRRTIVPDQAVIERDGRPLVFVVKNGRAQWTYVNPGRSNGREREILPDSTTGEIPVRPGDLVITEGHLTLTHDAPVRVVTVRDAPPGRP